MAKKNTHKRERPEKEDHSPKDEPSEGKEGPEKSPEVKDGKEHPGHSEEEEEQIDHKVEKDAERFRHKLVARPKTISFTPSTVQRRGKTEVRKTWMPLGAGAFLFAIAVIGILTSGNLFLTIEDKPLYSPNDGSLKGYILNKDGERLVGARVAVENTDILQFTGSDGHYQFKYIPKGECVVIATYPGYSTVRFPTMILGGTQLEGIGDTNLTLPKAPLALTDDTKGTMRLKGVVLDNNMNPEQNATVLDEALGKNVTSAKNGTFDLGQVPVGKRTIIASRAGFFTLRLTFYATPNRTDLQVVMTPGNGTRLEDRTTGKGYIKGRVIDLNGNPMPNALVDVNGSAQRVDANGEFSIAVDAGEVTVTATAVSKTSSAVRTFVDTSGGQHDTVLQLSFDIPMSLSGDRDALRSNLTTCGIAIIGMSAFMFFTAVTSFQRRRIWIAVTGSLFGAVMMLVMLQYALVLGLIAFGLLIFSRREFE
jgi:hypothetical protein